MCGIKSNGLPLPVTFTSYTRDCACTDAVVNAITNRKNAVIFFISQFLAVRYRPSRIVTESLKKIKTSFCDNIPTLAKRSVYLFELCFSNGNANSPKIFDQPYTSTPAECGDIPQPGRTAGAGDIDSGPVIFQLGAAASIVGMRTFATYDEASQAYAIQCGIEAFGFAIQGNNEKKYILGMLPMADAFITWAETGIPVDTYTASTFNPTWFHIYSAIATTIIISLLIIQWRDKLWNKQA